jgi:uncharacterized membrane protein YbhN (UPF0104 family)
MGRWVRVAVSITLLALIFVVVPWDEMQSAFSRLPLGAWAAVLLGFIAGHGLGVVKWRALVNAGGARLTVRDAVRCYGAGLFANLCLPTVVGGDVLRATLAGKVARNAEAAWFGGLSDRAIDIAATVLLIAVGGVLVRAHYPQAIGNTLGLGAVLGLLALPLVGWFVARRPLNRWPSRLRRPIARSLVVIRRIRRSPSAALTAVGISLAMQAGFVLLNAWIGHRIGVDVALGVWFFVWPLAKVAGLMPISLGGLAVRDATLAALLAPAGVPVAIGVVAALIWQTIAICGGLIGGLVWWSLQERTPQLHVDPRSA